MSRQSTKNKKYALRKIGKFFGSCVVATVITLGGAAIMAPNVTVYASDTTADGEADIDSLSDSNAGYEVIIPKGKKYIRNDEIESHTPVLKEEGYNGRSFILPKEGEEGYFFDHPMSELFTKLYDKDNDGNVDDKYKNPEPVDNSHAGETIDGATVPYRSEINPKYPHVVDSGLTGDSLNAPGVWKYNPDGKYAPSDGVINDQDTIVVARKPITVDENANDNVVKEDGSVVLTGEYKIHVNEGDHIDKKDDVYEVGTKPTVERTPIPFETTYKRDDSVPEGTEEEVTAGVNGEKVTTTTYELNVQTGEVTANAPTSETTNPVTRVVKKGTQPKVEKTPIPFETTYERDDSVPEGTEEEVTAGKNGETVKTTTYELNPTTGEVTANAPTSETTNPVTRVVKRGTQPKEEKTPIPFETRYERDDSVPEGTEEVVTAGVNGETVKTTTYELNPTTGEVTANEPTTTTTNPVTKVVKRGTQPKVEKTPLPFPTRYERDDSVPEGTEEEVTAGKNGETVKTTTYNIDETTGVVTPNEPTSVTTDPVTRVVKRGTQPKVEKTPLPFPTRYERDDSVPEGTEEEVTAGKNGETVKTTTYNIDETTGVVTPNEPTSVTTDPVTRVVKRGTQPKVEKTPLPFPTRYERDDSVPEGTEEEVTAGKNGETVKTTTYNIDETTGVVTPNEPTSVTTDPVTRVVKRGTQPKVEKTPIPFETTYERDDSVPEGTEEEVTAGKNGETVKTTTYNIDETTGVVTPNEPTSVTTDPVTRVVKRGTQPKVEKTPLPFPTRYERDDSVPEGTEEVVTAGVNGETVKTTTYELNPTTGEVTANEPTTTTTNPVTKVVKRGTQPKEEKTPIPFETRYERDDSVPEGTEEEVTAGKNGETVKTTTYELNPTTGEVTANEPKTVTTDPVTRVVKRGTQPKVEKTPIPFETTYERDDSVPEGTEEEVTAGKNGETVKTTTYNIDETTGVVTPNEPTSVTTDPVTRVVKRGTQPKVEKTPENSQPEQPGEGTPENPQPKPGEGTPSGDKPTDKPTEGTPSGDKPTDKPTEGTSSSPESSTSHSTTPSSSPSSSPSTSTSEKPNKAQTPSPEQPASPATSKVSEQKDEAVATATSEKTVDSATSTKTSDKAELPNTGTEANANLAALGLLGALSGFGLLARKKKED